MATSLTGISPATISEDGGTELELSGAFTVQHRYRVYLGGLGTAADPGCPSGKAGQGFDVYPWTADTLKCFSPVLAPGGPYTVTVVDQDDATSDQLVGAVAVTQRQFQSKVYAMRRLFTPWFKTGPRAVDREVL